MKKTVFSGVQPTGCVHLGNYLGAIKQWVRSQDEDYTRIFCIVDLHAITIYQNPEELKRNTLELLAVLLASGLDTDKSILFAQSHNHHHAELSWILNCVTRIGWLNRMTQFKDKAGKNREKFSSGLYVYPNLQAADILLYDTDLVPIGEDQKQHIELCRDIASKFNNDYKDIFKLPEDVINKNTARIMSLNNSSNKMSKSDPSENSKILITDSNDIISKKIAKSKTDDGVMPQAIQELEQRPEIKNLISIYSFCSNKTTQEVINMYQGHGFSSFKKDLTEVIIKELSVVRDKYNEIIKDSSYLMQILAKGKESSMKISEAKLKEVKEAVGFVSL